MALLGALGHLANLGQFVEIGQGHAHQKEQIHWTHRNYRLDVQALKIDLLGAARDDVRGTYDTYIERLDTLLLLNALLLPFAFNTLQFSDEFVPKTEDACDHECFEARNPWIADLWVYLVGLSLVMPFWSLLLLLWCKIKLDNWLQFTLGELQKLRREIITRPAASAEAVACENAYANHEEIVTCLGSFIVEYQDFFSDVWSSQCAPLVHNATRLLWSSAYVSVGLVGLMFWIFLVNRKGEQNRAHWHFAWVIVTGLLAPVLVLVYTCVRHGRLMPEPQRSLLTPRRSSAAPYTSTASPRLAHSLSTRSLASRSRAGDVGGSGHAEELLGGRVTTHALEQD